MKYIRRSDEIEAMQLKYPMTIEGPNGTVRGEKGDYLVTEGERQYFLSPDEFTAAFAVQQPDPPASPTYVPYPVPAPYPVYPQPRPWYPTWYYNGISISPNTTITSLGSGLTLHGTVSGSSATQTLTNNCLLLNSVGD